MAKKLKVPSLQHLARMSKSDSTRVMKQLLALLENSPTFSYEPLYALISDMLVLRTPYEQVVEAVLRKGYRKDVEQRYLDILPLVKKFFDGHQVTAALPIAPRYYPLAKDLRVPFSPPMLFFSKRKAIFPWFLFWKSNPLKGESLSLFVTLVDEILKQDSDLDESKFVIVDLSFDEESEARILRVLPAETIPRLSDQRKRELLQVFVEGYRLAEAAAAQRTRDKENSESEIDPNQLDLYTS